jgi:hypothetical protein
MSSKRVSALLVTAALAATMMIGLLAAPAQAALRHIDGTVVSKNADNHTFRITTQSGNRVRIRVNSGTVFQRIPGGFKGLNAGMNIEVEAQPTDSGLLAKHVETRGGGGGDNGGHDDGPNHT